MSNIENQESQNNREVRIKANAAQSLESVLNTQGYSFQYSVMRRAEELRKNGQSLWRLEGAEFPVAFKNEVMHIDFIFEYLNLFLIAECKRVNPARGYWCFAKSPYTWRNSTGKLAQFDQIRMFSQLPQFNSSTIIAPTEREIMDIGLEVSTGEKGDAKGDADKSAINKSVSQVLKGQSGYINYLCNQGKVPHNLKVDNDYIFIPVIFTTARIFVTDTDLGAADLERGHLPANSVNAEEKEWVWLNHNRSINLTHDVKFDYEANRHENYYFREFTRSVAIVGTKGIDSFLKTQFDDWLF